MFFVTEEDGEAAPAPAIANIVPPVAVPAQGLGAAHQALLQGGGPTGFQPYKKPEMFGAKVFFSNLKLIAGKWKLII